MRRGQLAIVMSVASPGVCAHPRLPHHGVFRDRSSGHWPAPGKSDSAPVAHLLVYELDGINSILIGQFRCILASLHAASCGATQTSPRGAQNV